MSRNFRQKTAPSLAQNAVGGKQNIDDSSDDDYAGVDQISDSEEDEPDVEVAEEQAIIDSEEDDQDTPRPINDDDQWDGFQFDGQEEILGQDMAFFEEQLAVLAGVSDGDALQTTSEDEVHTIRRVRFNLSDSDTGDDEDDGFFPDIFLPKDELDSSFRREIDEDDGDGLLSDVSWEAANGWDVPGSDVTKALEENEDEDTNGDSDSEVSTGSSGYESDDGGYTTDEDLPAAAQFATPRVLDRQASQSSSEEEVPIRRTPVRRGPKLGVWTVTSDRPFMIAKNEMKILMYNRKAIRRFSVDAIAGTPMQTPSRHNSIIESSPMISNSGNIMMSAMGNFGDPFTFGNQFLGGQALGPPEAFYPFTSIDADGTMVQDSSSSYDDDDMSDHDLWNVEDFLEFGEETSDNENNEEVEQSSDSPADPASTPAPSSTPARPTTARSEDQVHPLLDHFNQNTGIVSSFRRNQNRHQLLTRNIASRDSLAFGGTHLDGTIRGIKSGRLHHANAPITPARKARSLKSEVVPSSPASPLAELNKKRKYNGEEFNGHKRNKSLI